MNVDTFSNISIGENFNAKLPHTAIVTPVNLLAK
jgi:hypothetical protein